MLQTSFLSRSAGGNFGQFGVAWHAVNFNCVTVSLNRSVGEDVFFPCRTIAICNDNSDENGGRGSSTNNMIQNNRK